MILSNEKIEDGAPGSYWFEMLIGLEEPQTEGFRPLSSASEIKIPANFNVKQREACLTAFKRPDVFCLQGPPGTGKTDVLATIANAFSSDGREVLVICHTHHAVNNALNKIHKVAPNLPVIKIGDELKGDELNENIIRCQTYNSYMGLRKKRKNARHKSNDIVGMTIQSAFISLGLRNSGFNPNIILVDEAGQIPFTYGALIGSFKVTSVVFIGDDRQMPPIFHEKLVKHPFSTSIFSYLSDKYPDMEQALTTTYRMNDEITSFVSKHFYEPYGVTLESSELSANRRLELDAWCEDEDITNILKSEQSIISRNVSKENIWEDSNPEEAEFIANLVHTALAAGMQPEDLAVITPYRRQVNLVREMVEKAVGTELPELLIDTVERLQGQDVELIIISLCVTSSDYYSQQQSFIMNPNRLNVMISRAKRKVIIIGKYPIK